ncbi:Uncharacterized protein GBIM_04839 [Gryllus bimaculatus]|nr:Uncharacterized protein GBIM_04839 [Gryllus bimaculatus]
MSLQELCQMSHQRTLHGTMPANGFKGPPAAFGVLTDIAQDNDRLLVSSADAYLLDIPEPLVPLFYSDDYRIGSHRTTATRLPTGLALPNSQFMRIRRTSFVQDVRVVFPNVVLVWVSPPPPHKCRRPTSKIFLLFAMAIALLAGAPRADADAAADAAADVADAVDAARAAEAADATEAAEGSDASDIRAAASETSSTETTTPPLNIDPQLRRALLQALTRLEKEAQEEASRLQEEQRHEGDNLPPATEETPASPLGFGPFGEPLGPAPDHSVKKDVSLTQITVDTLPSQSPPGPAASSDPQPANFDNAHFPSNDFGGGNFHNSVAPTQLPEEARTSSNFEILPENSDIQSNIISTTNVNEKPEIFKSQQPFFPIQSPSHLRSQRQETGTAIVDFQKSISFPFAPPPPAPIQPLSTNTPSLNNNFFRQSSIQTPRNNPDNQPFQGNIQQFSSFPSSQISLRPNFFSTPTRFQRPPPVDKQLQNLLYQSGIARDLQSNGASPVEDLNILTKVLSLNHDPQENTSKLNSLRSSRTTLEATHSQNIKSVLPPSLHLTAPNI